MYTYVYIYVYVSYDHPCQSGISGRLLDLQIRLIHHVWGHAPRVHEHCKAPDPGKHQIL